MGLRPSFSAGQLYNLADIQPIWPTLKTRSYKMFRSGAIFYLCRESGTDHVWIHGPFNGPGSSLFMYAGSLKSKEQAIDVLENEFKRIVARLDEGIPSLEFFEFALDVVDDLMYDPEGDSPFKNIM